MSEERARILQMIGEGKISAEEGAKLLGALRDSEAPSPTPTRGKSGRWFRVRVIDLETDRVKVNVNLPMSLVSVATKMGARFSPEMEEFDWNALLATIEEGAVGKLVEVENDEGRERVEVFVE
ncbi:MAG: hypothetical protein JXA89_01615 [Anaerolineae bacterium]|nr:hypothetical protein [Anaerolineae bacterium]